MKNQLRSSCHFLSRHRWIAVFVAIAAANLPQFLRGAEPPPFTVEVRGSGAPLVFIPGLTCPGAVWDETVARYADRYECHILSLAGFAGTAPVDLADGYLPVMKAAIEAYLADHQLERPILVGHSLGGFLALWIGTEAGDRLGGIVAIDSLPFFPAAMNPAATVESARPMAEQMRAQMGSMPPEQWAPMQRMMLQSLITAPEKIELALRWSLASDTATVGQAMYDLNTIDLRGELAKIEVPTLVLGAWIAYQPYGATRESTEGIFRTQYAQLPTWELKMSDAGKHFLMWDDPALTLSSLDAFLSVRE